MQLTDWVICECWQGKAWWIWSQGHGTHTDTHTVVTGHRCDFVRQSWGWNNEWISTLMEEDKVVYLHDRKVLKEEETLNK